MNARQRRAANRRLMRYARACINPMFWDALVPAKHARRKS